MMVTCKEGARTFSKAKQIRPAVPAPTMTICFVVFSSMACSVVDEISPEAKSSFNAVLRVKI